ncbi:hypothetical protein H9P43_006237 [Blastocladiella emersonii ATCC 22665]|nr:hypothetical protein H9P43_006237 [Blastocladiella emersonii ATCC 22665]
MGFVRTNTDRRRSQRAYCPPPSAIPDDATATPHLELPEARVMFFVSALYEKDTAHMRQFAERLESVLLATDHAGYESHVFGSYPKSSLAAAASALVAEVTRFTEGVKTLRVLLVGQGMGGLVAAEAARSLVLPKAGKPGDERVGKVTVDGVIAINTPFFMFPDNLWSAAEYAAMALYTGRLAQSRKPDDAGLGRKIANNPVSRFFWRDLVGGAVKLTADITAATVDALGGDASWNERHKFLDPLIDESFADRVKRLMALVDRGVPVVSLLTRIKGANPETYAYVPARNDLPEPLRECHQFVELRSGKALDVAENALDESKQPDAFLGLVDQCANIVGAWAPAGDGESVAAAASE